MRVSRNRWDAPLRTRPFTVIGVLFALFGALPVQFLELTTGITVGRLGSSVAKWVLVGVVLVIVLLPERETLASIGIARPDRWDVVVGVGIVVLGILSVAVATPLVDTLGFSTAPFGGEQNGGQEQTATALLLALFVGVTAGITEELLYRGYALERLEALTGSTWVASAVTAVVFVVVHFGGHSFGGLLVIAPLAVLLTVGYVWRRNIFVPIVGHVLLNGLWQFVALLLLVFDSL